MALSDEKEFAKVLYWGNYGSGKTTAMASLAELGMVHWVRIDKGLKAGPLRRMGIPVTNIEPIDDLNPSSLENTVEEWRGNLHDNKDAFAGVCFDTITALIERRVEVYTDEAWKEYLARSKRNHTEVDRALRYRAADTGDIYQPVTQEVGRLVRAITDLECHVAFAAQIRKDIDKVGGTSETQFGPAASPAIRGQLIGYCDVVIETAMDGSYEDDEEAGAFVGYPRPRAGREGKDRFGALPRILVNPTMPRIIRYINGELDFRTDPDQLRYKDTLKARADRQKHEEDDL